MAEFWPLRSEVIWGSLLENNIYFRNLIGNTLSIIPGFTIGEVEPKWLSKARTEFWGIAYSLAPSSHKSTLVKTWKLRGFLQCLHKHPLTIQATWLLSVKGTGCTAAIGDHFTALWAKPGRQQRSTQLFANSLQWEWEVIPKGKSEKTCGLR